MDARTDGGTRIARARLHVRDVPIMKVVLDMQDRRPVWSMPEWVVERVRGELPEGWELVVVRSAADGSGDGSAGASQEALAAVEGAAVYLGFGIAPEILRAGRGLRWVHSGAAGVGSSLTAEMLASSAVFTNSAGIHGPPMAENVVGMILHFARGFDVAGAAQRQGRWGQEDFYANDVPVREVAGSTVGILGYGGIGREVARRVRPLGANVLALRRRAPAAADGAAGAGDAATSAHAPASRPASAPLPLGKLEVLHGDAGFGRLLEESDFLVVSAPDTPETRGMVDAAALARMRPGAVLLNVARGALVDEDALVDALRSSRLRGAGLDVFRAEPLPDGHPFYALANVLLTPHVSAVTRGFWERQAELIVENLRAFLKGEPLRNEVDCAAGY